MYGLEDETVAIPAETLEQEAAGETGDGANPRAHLPSRFRLLGISPREPSWIGLTLQLDAEHCHQPQFRWVSTSAEALTLLRAESFDCIVVSAGRPAPPGAPETEPALEILSLIRAIRASGCDDAVLLLADRLDERHWADLCGLDCEFLITPNLWESNALLPVIKRAVARVELQRENHRLEIADHRRLVRERDEAEHLLTQQRQIIQDLYADAGPAGSAGAPHSPHQSDEDRPDVPTEQQPEYRVSFTLPDEVNDYYHELLRTYVIMGSGSLGDEIAYLAELIAAAGLTPREALQLHVERLETLIRGLGRRSTRHVMGRADLLVLELMMHLGECYQRQAAVSGSTKS